MICEYYFYFVKENIIFLVNMLFVNKYGGFEGFILYLREYIVLFFILL